MKHVITPLAQEFEHDHRSLTRGFAEIIEALRRDDWGTAVQLAIRLNQEGGAHIAFEERTLYPIVRKALGDKYAENLYDEHRIAIHALRDLIQNPEPVSFNQERKHRLIDELQTGLDHAVSCGTLLSHLTVFDEETQLRLLGELQSRRTEGKTMLEMKP